MTLQADPYRDDEHDPALASPVDPVWGHVARIGADRSGQLVVIVHDASCYPVPLPLPDRLLGIIAGARATAPGDDE